MTPCRCSRGSEGARSRPFRCRRPAVHTCRPNDPGRFALRRKVPAADCSLGMLLREADRQWPRRADPVNGHCRRGRSHRDRTRLLTYSRLVTISDCRDLEIAWDCSVPRAAPPRLRRWLDRAGTGAPIACLPMPWPPDDQAFLPVEPRDLLSVDHHAQYAPWSDAWCPGPSHSVSCGHAAGRRSAGRRARRPVNGRRRVPLLPDRQRAATLPLPGRRRPAGPPFPASCRP